MSCIAEQPTLTVIVHPIVLEDAPQTLPLRLLGWADDEDAGRDAPSGRVDVGSRRIFDDLVARKGIEHNAFQD